MPLPNDDSLSLAPRWLARTGGTHFRQPALVPDDNHQDSDHRRISFVVHDYQEHPRRRSHFQFTPQNYNEDDDEEFLPPPDDTTYLEEEDEEEEVDVEEEFHESHDEEDEGMDESAEEESRNELSFSVRSLRSNSRSPPPPPPYQGILRLNAALSLATMLNNLTTSSNSLNSHIRRLHNRNLTVMLTYDDDDDDENDDDGVTTDVAEEDEIRSRWRVLRHNEDQFDFHIQQMANRPIGLPTSETIFKNHFGKHLALAKNRSVAKSNRLGLKKFDLLLEQRQKLLLMYSEKQLDPAVGVRKSRKRKLSNGCSSSSNNGNCRNYAESENYIVSLQPNSFLQSGMVFQSPNSNLAIKFTNVSYEENLVNGIFSSTSSGDDSALFQFNGTIVDFANEDLRYTTIHGADDSKFQTSLDRNILLSDHHQFLEFKKKLDKWFKLPPFNSLKYKASFTKMITCHDCLNCVLEDFILLKITILINEKNSLEIQDHLQLLASINRSSGELYVISGELDCFQRCASCNVIHSDSTTSGNSIIDKILIIDNDARLRHFKNLLINIDLLNTLQQRDWRDIREENVWKNEVSALSRNDTVGTNSSTTTSTFDNNNNNNNNEDNDNDNNAASSISGYPDQESSNGDFVLGKKLKKNNMQIVRRSARRLERDDVSNDAANSSNFDRELIASCKKRQNYDYDELYVTRFIPKFGETKASEFSFGGGFNCFNVSFS